MDVIERVDVLTKVFDIGRDLSITAREVKAGPPMRIDGMTVGIVTMDHDAPHGGEVHPDGDEILYVISGRARVIAESTPDEAVELRPGDACIVRQGEWHRVNILEQTQLIYITPGPNGDHRPQVPDGQQKLDNDGAHE
jgi:mannose-6-phosphate isomerase-like protein (cupin superfamily)